MKLDTDEPNEGFGLLANGSAGQWAIDLDESPDGTRWSLQLDGPQVYLDFAVKKLGVIAKALDYLRSGRTRTDPLPLGTFGPADVSFHWDNEDNGRCFLIVGLKAGCMRVSLSAQDTVMLADALEQVLEDLPPEARSGQ
jgi:hypothetical protein